METVTAKSILDGVFHMAGVDPDDASEADKLAMLEHLASRLEDACEYYRWPQYLTIEERFFRADWAAGTAYADGAEVYYPTDDAYYQANQATSAGESPTTNPEKWDELTEFRRTVDYEQTGETAIGVVLKAWDVDPLSDEGALEIGFAPRQDGILIPPTYTGTSIWLEIRARAPDAHASAIYDAADTYAAGDIVYFPAYDGNIYEANQATSAGQTPGTHAAKWDLVSIPRFLARALKAGAFSDWLSSDERPNAGAAWDAKFNDLLEEQVWQLTKLQGQTGTPQVSR